MPSTQYCEVSSQSWTCSQATTACTHGGVRVSVPVVSWSDQAQWGSPVSPRRTHHRQWTAGCTHGLTQVARLGKSWWGRINPIYPFTDCECYVCVSLIRGIRTSERPERHKVMSSTITLTVSQVMVVPSCILRCSACQSQRPQYQHPLLDIKH